VLQAQIPPASRPEQNVPIELMHTVRMPAIETRVALPTAPVRPAPQAPAPKAAEPLVSDDLFAQIGARPAAPAVAAAASSAFDPMKTQKLDLDLNGDMGATQKIDVAAAQKADAGATRKLDPEAQVTQRLDDSIWRLQEARRILAGLPQKS
jgi:hypothetical protein